MSLLSANQPEEDQRYLGAGMGQSRLQMHHYTVFRLGRMSWIRWHSWGGISLNWLKKSICGLSPWRYLVMNLSICWAMKFGIMKRETMMSRYGFWLDGKHYLSWELEGFGESAKNPKSKNWLAWISILISPYVVCPFLKLVSCRSFPSNLHVTILVYCLLRSIGALILLTTWFLNYQDLFPGCPTKLLLFSREADRRTWHFFLRPDCRLSFSPCSLDWLIFERAVPS